MRSPGESSRDRSRPRRWIGARSPASWAFAARQPHGRSRPQQRLDRAALVHRAVALRHLLKRQLQVEDLAGVDLPVPDQLDKLGQEAPHRGGTAVQVHMREEELLPRDLHVVEHAHEPDVTACPRGADGLHHRLLRADRLDDRVRPETVGELLDPFRALLAALGHDLGRAELPGEPLAGPVPAHRDDPLRAKLLGGEHREQPDGAVADDRHRLARTGLGRHGAKPAGAEHVGGREQAGDHVLRRQARRRYEGAVGERDAGVLRLRAGWGTGLPVDAGRVVAGPADLAGVVGGEERADDELAQLDQTYLAADLLDDADVLMAHRGRLVDRLDAAIGPEVRAAHAGERQSDEGVGLLDDRRVGALLEAHVPGAVKNCSLHDYLLLNIEYLVASSMNAAAPPGVTSTPVAFTATASRSATNIATPFGRRRRPSRARRRRRPRPNTATGRPRQSPRASPSGRSAPARSPLRAPLGCPR